MALCPRCGGQSFRVDRDEGADGESLLACASCGSAVGPALGSELDDLRRELQLLREELSRLRQAVNFLNQRVR